MPSAPPLATAQDSADLASRLIGHLHSHAADDRQWLLDLVQQIDLAFLADESDQLDAFFDMLLAKATVALGMLIQEVDPEATSTIAATTSAARHYVSDPTEENDLQFWDAATNSFPFGPGDGCYGISELGGHCEAGGGCHSCAGFLWEVGRQRGWKPVRARLIAELEPWLVTTAAATTT